MSTLKVYMEIRTNTIDKIEYFKYILKTLT